MGVPAGRDQAEAREVELFLKAGHYKLAFAVVCLKTLRWPAGLGAGSIVLNDIARAALRHFGII